MRRWSIDQGQQLFCANDAVRASEDAHNLGCFRMAQADTQTPDNQLSRRSDVGQRFTSRTHVVDATEIKAFARQFDPQPFHLDEEMAKRAFFGELVASGWHTAAITMRLLVETGLPLAGGIIGAGGEVSWPKPTRPGDTLAVTSEIEEIAPSRSRPDRGTLKVRSETRNQRDEISRCKTVVARLSPCSSVRF